MRTSRSNMRRLRVGLIGSISAWLPSRRSTAHHMGAVLTTLSGQLRSATVIGSTSSAKVRYRFTGIDVARWVFHAGWQGWGAPEGVDIVRTDVKASKEGGMGLFTALLRIRLVGIQTGASGPPATGSQSGSD